MYNNKRKIKWIVYFSLCLIFFTFAIIFFVAYKVKPFILLGVISTILFFLFWFLAWMIYKEYQFKFLFFGKDFKNKVNKSLNIFNTTNEEFVKEFIADAKSIYRYHGQVISFSHSTNCTDLHELTMLYSEMVSSIETGRGFAQFFNFVDSCELSSEKVYLIINNKILSNELRYLLFKVYNLTMFTFGDNGFSEEFTKINKQNIEKVNNVFDPILFNFKDELNEALKKLQSI